MLLQVARKRSRWLQYHDQKTAGIPGLLPLYIGMKARITEKLCKSPPLLKHSPCTVVGWELDPEDAASQPPDKSGGQGSERLLKKHPRCIYIRFEGAKWKVGTLDEGVYPLKPVKKVWELNQQTKTKVHRWGFTLLPDYASTAHMVQGMTLPAIIAECGSSCDNVSIKDMLAAYVALSRVRKAEMLLLLRTFSKQLFQQGPPPGPHCLMRFLRSKFAAAPHNTASTASTAAEYSKLAAEQKKAHKEKSKQEGES